MAVQKETIENPGTTAATISSIIALIMIRNRPNVSTLIGKEITIKSGFSVAFTMPSTIPANNILTKFSNCIPATIWLTIKNEIALIIQEAIILLFMLTPPLT